MPWRTTSLREQRIQFVIRAQGKREALARLCREFGISRPTGYLWLRRYEQTRTLSAVREQSRRPHRSPRRTAADTERQVVALRQQTGWGAKKLRILLCEQAAVQLPVRTIHRILARHELIAHPEPGAAPGRFERSEPNQLWQMDSKAKYTLADGECHALAIVDDHSRYLLGLHALSALVIAQAHPCLVETFRGYGLPQAMLMDHGWLWWSSTNGWGLTSLSIRLIEQDITLLYGRVAHPQTQGKVERLNGTWEANCATTVYRAICASVRRLWPRCARRTTSSARTKRSGCNDRRSGIGPARAHIRSSRAPGSIRPEARCGGWMLAGCWRQRDGAGSYAKRWPDKGYAWNTSTKSCW
jgi:transposase